MIARRLFPLFLLLLAAPIFFAGVRRELPYFFDADERLFVRPAVLMAATGDFDPYWFGSPGSTLIYPLAALIHLEGVIVHGDPVFEADPEILARFRADLGPYFELGRGLAALYGVLSLALVFFVGAQAFSPFVARLGAVWAILPPIALIEAQNVRTDSAATLWGLVALLLLLRAGESPTFWRMVAAGGVIGVAVATRYFMVAPAGSLAILVVGVVRSAGDARPRRIAYASAAFVAIPIGFLLVTPYFLPEFRSALGDIAGEARHSHPGSDGLSPLGNLGFYLVHVWPDNLGWPLTLLAVYGASLALFGGRLDQRVLTLFVPIFLV